MPHHLRFSIEWERTTFHQPQFTGSRLYGVIISYETIFHCPPSLLQRNASDAACSPGVLAGMGHQLQTGVVGVDRFHHVGQLPRVAHIFINRGKRVAQIAKYSAGVLGLPPRLQIRSGASAPVQLFIGSPEGRVGCSRLILGERSNCQQSDENG